MDRTAVLIDGGYFKKRMMAELGRKSPSELAELVSEISRQHVSAEPNSSLYRIFYYDCAPVQKKLHKPISKIAVELGNTPQARFAIDLHNELLKVRKVALRLGELVLNPREPWVLRDYVQKKLILGEIHYGDLTDNAFRLNVGQKGVDMRIGLDIASLAFKRQVTQIVLISGDSDFVPAAKLARREGLDVVLDPLGAHVNDLLNEHVDGLIRTKPTFSLTTN